MDLLTRLIEAAVGVACVAGAAAARRGTGGRWLGASLALAGIAAVVHAVLG